MKRLLDGPYKEKVHLFALGLPDQELGPEKQLYNHAKTLIIDDEYVLVGSTGVEQAGFTNDAEMSMGITSPKQFSGPDSFAGKLRQRIWGEFLMMYDGNFSSIRSVEDGINALKKDADTNVRRVRHYRPQSIDHWYNKEIIEFVEPYGGCDTDHRVTPSNL
eukprot:g2294.t1